MGLNMPQFVKIALRYVSFAALVAILTLILTYFLSPYLGFYIYSKQSIDELRKELNRYKIRNSISFFVGLTTGYVETTYAYIYMSVNALEKADYTSSEEFLSSCNKYLTLLKQFTGPIVNLSNKADIDEETKELIKTLSEKLSNYISKLRMCMDAVRKRDLTSAKNLVKDLALLKDVISSLSVEIT